MKNTFFLFLCALLLTFSASAQSTVDSIASKYKLLPMPEAFTIEKAFPVIGAYYLSTEAQTETTGNEVLATDESNLITISLDTVNKGIVWVEGLPMGKFKAYLKRSPSTYRIIAQKTESGKQIPEGTLYFDADANILQVALGKSFDESDPTAVFALHTGSSEVVESEVKVKTKNSKTKSKNKITFYTANKAVVAQQETEATSSL